MPEPHTPAARRVLTRHVSLVAVLGAAALVMVGVPPAVGADAGPDRLPATDVSPAPRDELGLPSVEPSGAPAPVPDRVLVRFGAGASATTRRELLTQAGGKAVGAVASTGFVAVEPSRGSAGALADALSDDPGVAEVQVDHVRSALGWEDWVDEPLLEEAWPYLDLARLPAAWQQTNGSGVTIAVLDGAVAPDAEFSDRLVPGTGDAEAVSFFSQSAATDLVVDAYGWFRTYT